MSVQAILTRIEQIQQIGQPQPAQPSSTAATSGASSFSSQLQSATSSYSGATPTANVASLAAAGLSSPLGATGLSATSLTGAQGSVGQRMVALAQQQLGVSEQPPGSNDGPQIATYRQATAGSGVGPWCAYFQSWLAQQSGAPLGEAGQGFGSVSALYGWAQRTGRAIPAGTQAPQAGDLIVWGGRHIGIVESVGTDGSITTIEGNSSDAVSRRHYGADGGGATGYVRLG